MIAPNYEWVRLLGKQARPVSYPDRHIGPFEREVPWNGMGVSGPILSEFPLSEFRPVWRIFGWPDDWPNFGKVDCFPFESVPTV